MPPLVVAVLGALVLRCTAAAAEEPARGASVSFHWTAPLECPTAGELQNHLTSSIGHGGAAYTVTAAAVATRADGHWRGDVTMSAGSWRSTRRVEGDTCRGVADAIVVIVALAASASRSEDASVAAPIRAERIEPRSGSEGALHLGASFLVDDGTLPGTGFGGEVMGGWSWRRLQLDLVGDWLGPTSATLRENALQGANIWLAELRGRACYDVFQGGFAVAPCVGGGAQWLVASGFGANHPGRAVDSMTVASFGARALIPLSARVGIHVAADAIVPLTRPDFTIVNGGTVYRSSSVAVRGAIGFDLHF